MSFTFSERPVTTTWFEMRALDHLRPAHPTHMNIQRATEPDAELLEHLWSSVGGPWSWVGRIHWTADQWQDLAADPNTRTWIGSVDGETAGYFELHQEGGDVEIKCLGLLPRFIGKGHGGHLLTEATRQAWNLGANRVFLDTSDKNAPGAAPNYRARGFVQFDERTAIEQVPEPF